jgi:hypothetical protein
MISTDERLRIQARQVAAKAAELGRYSIHVSVVLSLIFSLAAVSIISKNRFTNDLWVDMAAIAVPIPIALYFKTGIVSLGAFAYAAALVLILGAAVVFGI